MYCITAADHSNYTHITFYCFILEIGYKHNMFLCLLKSLSSQTRHPILGYVYLYIGPSYHYWYRAWEHFITQATCIRSKPTTTKAQCQLPAPDSHPTQYWQPCQQCKRWDSTCSKIWLSYRWYVILEHTSISYILLISLPSDLREDRFC